MTAAREHLSRAIVALGDADAVLLGLPGAGPAMDAHRTVLRELLQAQKELEDQERKRGAA